MSSPDEPNPTLGGRISDAARAATRGIRRAGRASTHAAHQVGRTAESAGRATRRLTHAQGAGPTGLGRLIELTATSSAGDALVTVGLAGTLFQMPIGSTRGPVATYLLISMIPFAIVAPFVGPALDRLRSGRRFVMAGTMLARGLLCWSLAAAVVHPDPVTLFPAAFGALVLSRAYTVSRAAVTPSSLPPDITLVTANARCNLAALIAAGVAAPIGAGLAYLGPEWALRLALLVFVVGSVSAVRLPPHFDDAEEETPSQAPSDAEGAPKTRWRRLINVGPVVAEALWANIALRALTGFLILYLAFLVMEENLPGAGNIAVALAALVSSAGAGALAGTAAGSWLRARVPTLIVLLTLGGSVLACAVTAAVFGLWPAVVLSFAGAFAQALAKLALDAIVQNEIGEEIRTSTFGVTEAVLQISWVTGGMLGLLMSIFSDGAPGLWIIALLLAATLAWLIIERRRRVMRLAASRDGERAAG